MKKMKIKFLFTAIAILAMSCGTKNAEQAKTGEAQEVASIEGKEYSLNQDESSLKWRGTKPGGEHIGTVDISEGNVAVSDGMVTGGSIVIDLNTIQDEDLSGNMAERLVGHLKSEDFFHVSEYPKAVFNITEVGKIENAEMDMPGYTVTGNLTMRGVTKSITFPAWIEVSENSVTAKTEEFSIDRTLWGVNFKSKSVFAEFKDDFIGDMINLKFDVSFMN